MAGRNDDGTLTTLHRDRVDVPALGLLVTQPDGAQREYRLGLDALVVGSSSEADVVLLDEAVSRTHCTLSVGPFGVVLTDLGSKNGTYISTVRVERAIVAPGQLLQVGRCKLELVVRDGGQSLPLVTDTRFGDAFGVSVIMRALFARLTRAAASPETILMLGESGTGKELVARAIHEASSRAARPLIALNCASVPEGLLGAELFGYAKGAFTGASGERAGLIEAAAGSTLFLDEVGDMPLPMQAALLRVLEQREVKRLGETKPRSVDFRLVAATNRDLEQAVRDGQFRGDLLFRLEELTLELPPLTARGDDVILLAHFFLRQAEAQLGLPLHAIGPAAEASLEQHCWPGNARELRAAMRRAAVLADRHEITPADLAIGGALTHVQSAPVGDDLGDLTRSLATARDAFVRRYIEAVVEQHDDNREAAAKALGIGVRTLYRHLS